jgi:ammonia channel protein AmtB
LTFGHDVGGLLGGLEYFALRGVGMAPSSAYAPTIPFLAFFLYQMMFVIITPALITGAFAGRMKFSSYLIFLVLWVILVYVPVAHWSWDIGGWMERLGFVDFAGGVVVHVTAGAAARAWVNSMLSAAAAMMTWLFADRIENGKFGAVAPLVGAVVGSILVGVFAQKSVNGISGLIEGNWRQFGVQVLGVVVCFVFSFVVTMLILKIMNAIHPIRVSEGVEAKGLDMGEFGEQAY